MRRMSTTLAALMMTVGALAAGPSPAEEASELQIWRLAERSGLEADYRAYLERYPHGDFAAIARDRVGGGRDPSAGADERPPGGSAERGSAAAEEALALTQDQRRNIQAALTSAGYDTRGVDGVFGDGTRMAISGWQRAGGDAPTGYLTEGQARDLLAAAGPAIVAETPEEGDTVRARASGDGASPTRDGPSPSSGVDGAAVE